MKNEHRSTLITLVPQLFRNSHNDFENLVKRIGRGAEFLSTVERNLSIKNLVTASVEAAVSGKWIADLVMLLEEEFPERDELKRIAAALGAEHRRRSLAAPLHSEQSRLPPRTAGPPRGSAVLGQHEPSESPPPADGRTASVWEPASSIVAYDGRSPALFSIASLLQDLGNGDSVIVAARTCVRWLGDAAARGHVKEAVGRGMRITFVIQDLYNKLADPRFSQLRDDQTKAVMGYDALVAATGSSTFPPALKYSSELIRNSRTLVMHNGAFQLLRYDLTFEQKEKPFVVFSKDQELARSIIEETQQIERAAVSVHDYRVVKDARKAEESFRTNVANAEDDHKFSSKIRGHSAFRLVRQAARIRLSLLDKLEAPAPLSVQILLTHVCSTHCAMCTVWEFSKGGDTSTSLELSGFRDLINDIASMGIRAVTLSGGEPLLFPEIASILAHCGEKGIKVGILTSGSVSVTGARGKALLDSLVKHCSWLQVSIDSFKKATYRSIRAFDENVPKATLDRCQAFLHELDKRSVSDVEVCFTIQKSNIDELQDVASLRRNMKAVVPPGIPVRFKFATGTFASRESKSSDGFLPSKQQLEALNLAWTFDSPGSDGRVTNVDYIRESLSGPHKIAAIAEGLPMTSQLDSLIRTNSPCRVMGHTMFIDHNGDVYPCCYLYNDNVWSWAERQRYLVGNWRDVKATGGASHNALKAIWNSDEFVQRRRCSLADLPREACGRCTRHMQQNTFLELVETALDPLCKSSGRERIDHALEIYDDPSNLRFRPLWL